MARWNLNFLANRIEQAGLNPSLWSEVLTDISEQVGAKGAVLVSTEKLMPGVPVSPSLEAMIDDYFRNGWNCNDLRAERCVPIILERGVTTERDFISPEEMRTSPYYQDWVARHGCRHFAGVGLRIAREFWCLSIQGSVAQGPFEPTELRKLSALCRPLIQAATFSRRLGFQQVLGHCSRIRFAWPVGRVIGRGWSHLDCESQGRVDATMRMIDPATRTLSFDDVRSQAAFSSLVAEAIGPDSIASPLRQTIAIRDRGLRRIGIRALALRDWARFSFASAKALLLFHYEDPSVGHDEVTSFEGFGLTWVETVLARELCSGASLRAVADKLEITYETARTYLKSIFAKTDTRRLGRIGCTPFGRQISCLAQCATDAALRDDDSRRRSSRRQGRRSASGRQAQRTRRSPQAF